MSQRLATVGRLVTEVRSEHRPYVGLEDVVGGEGRLIPEWDAAQVPPPTAGAASVEPGDVLFGKLRPYLRKTMVVQQPMHASTELIAIRPASNVEPRWLAHVIDSRPFTEWAVASSEGSKMPRTSWAKLRDFYVQVPSIDRQRRIAGFLDAETSRIVALIAAKQQMIDLLGRRLASKLDDLIARLGCDRAPIRRFVTSLTQGTSGVAGSEPAGDGEWGILKLSAVKSGGFRASENKVVGSGFPVDESLRPAVGDLLVTRSNTPAYVGDACAVREPVGSVLLPDLIYRIRLDRRMDAMFASMALRTSSSRWMLSSVARGTSQSMVKLRGEDILNVVVPVPQLDQQRALVRSHDDEVAHASALSSMLERQKLVLGERRQALITAAVTGELVV